MKRLFQIIFFCLISLHMYSQCCWCWPKFDSATRTAPIPFGNTVTFSYSNSVNFRGLIPYTTIVPSNYFIPDPGITTFSPPNSTPHNLNDLGVFSIFPVTNGETGTINFNTISITGFFLHVSQIASKIEFNHSFTLISQDGDLIVGSSMGLTNNILDASNVTPTTSPDDANATIFFDAGINQINYVLSTNNIGADGFNFAFTFPDECILKIVQNDTAVCAGKNLPLSVIFPAASIIWSTGDTSHSIHVIPTQTTIYYVTATCDGDTYNDSVMITVNQPSLQFTSISICQGENYLGYTTTGIYNDTLTATNGCDSIRSINLFVKPRSYSLLRQSICEGQNYLGYTATGTYIDTLVATNGCDSIRTLQLNVQSKPAPDLGVDKEICLGDSLVLDPGQFNSYLWQNGSTQNRITIKQPGLYSVTVTNNCDTTSDDILIKERICNIYFPSAFTPNNDGKNDRFKVLGAYNLIDYHLIVYSRWGQKVFETTDYTKGWAGIVNGRLQNSGVFVWYCAFKKPGNVNKTEMKGTVVLIK